MIFFLFLFSYGSKIPIYIGKISSNEDSKYHLNPETFPLCKKSIIKSKEVSTQTFLNDFAGQHATDIGFEIENMVSIENKNMCNRGISKNNYFDMRTAISKNMYIEFLINGTILSSAPIGTTAKDNFLYYYSHWNFSVYYQNGRIVYAKVSSSEPLPLSFESDLHFSYSVYPVLLSSSSVSKFENEKESKNWFHYYSLMKISLYVLSIISGLGFFLAEKLSDDLSDQKESQFDDFDDNRGQFHWRLLHGDIFRSPKRLDLLSSIVGASAHLVISFIFLIFIHFLTNLCETFGFFNLFLVIYVLLSGLAGYVSSLVSVQFGEKQFFKSSFATSFIFFIPLTIILLIFTCMSLFPLKSLIVLIFCVCVIIVPFSIFGGYFGSTNKVVGCPCDVAVIPRKQPKLPFLLRNYAIFPVVGCILSFPVVHEFGFILDSFVLGDMKWFLLYFLTVFLSSFFLISLISIVLVYVLMKNEFYAWQWTSFLAPFCSSFFLFLYLINYINNCSLFQTNCELFAGFLLSLGISYLVGITFGGIGYVSANVFVQVLFSNLKFS